MGDAVLAAIGGLLVAQGEEATGIALLVFTALRAVIGVIALVVAARALADRNPNDDRPSILG